MGLFGLSWGSRFKDSVIDEVAKGLGDYRSKLLENLREDEAEESLRSEEEGQFVLEFLDFFKHQTDKFLKRHPQFETYFEKNFTSLEDFQDPEHVAHLALSAPEVFKNNDHYQLIIPGGITEDIRESYKELFQSWIDETLDIHEGEQKKLEALEEFQVPDPLNCKCQKCIALYRTKLRESVFGEQKIKLEKAAAELEADVLELSLNQVATRVSDVKKSQDKAIRYVRYKLKRSSVNKLEQDLKSLFESQFSASSEVGQTYKQRVKSYLLGVLEEHEEFNVEFLNENDWDKFFNLLGPKLWRHEPILRRELFKFINSVIAFKRKDISATILRDYLGQFWLHSPARRKNRKIIYHMGPTNSGKTYHAIQALCEAPSGCYLAPLRLLAGELYDTMNQKGVATTLLTGEEVIENPEAKHYASTIEMAKLKSEFDCCVIDEIQMMSDPQRGWAWTRALIGLDSDEIHLCGDGSVLDLVEQVLKLTGDELEIRNYERMTELKIEDHPVAMEDLKPGDALVVFSRRNALKYKAELEKRNFKVSVIYGMLSPEVRREQARKFDMGETDIIVSTDAIAMGMNLPVRRIVFSTFTKYIINREHHLTDSEIKQIAGRAGRFNRFPTGFVTYLDDERNSEGKAKLQSALNCELDQKPQAMVGPDLDIFESVNHALQENELRSLDFSEFLRLFNTMDLAKPFYCVQLNEMIEVAEMVENANAEKETLSFSEIFGFSCAPVNLGLMDHVQLFISIVNKYVHGQSIEPIEIETDSDDIDYLETAIKCVELYQWLARHFAGKFFYFNEQALLANKGLAIAQLNKVLSEKTYKHIFRRRGGPPRGRGRHGAGDRSRGDRSGGRGSGGGRRGDSRGEARGEGRRGEGRRGEGTGEGRRGPGKSSGGRRKSSGYRGSKSGGSRNSGSRGQSGRGQSGRE